MTELPSIHQRPRVRFASDAQVIAYRSRTGDLDPAELGPLFVHALRFLPDDLRPLEAVVGFARLRLESPEAAGCGLIDFILSWLEPETPGEQRALHEWQERRDAGLD